MEPLWSPAVAIGGKQWQIGREAQPLKQAKTVAVGCDRLPIGAHGKEGVDGSSPSEGFRLLPAQRPVPLSISASTGRPRTSTAGAFEVVEQADRVLASVAGEVAVVRSAAGDQLRYAVVLLVLVDMVLLRGAERASFGRCTA
jgi:hypothetical protein